MSKASDSSSADAILIRVHADPLDAEVARRAVESPRNGAVLLFFGNVRETHEGRSVEAVTYEAYAEMAEEELRRVGTEVARRHDAPTVAILHRTGRLRVGDTSLVVAVGAPHRKEAFACGLEIIDELKKRAPIWKTEHGASGDRFQAGTLPEVSD
jgi:molybdopterin synthase catalytic subunit